MDAVFFLVARRFCSFDFSHLSSYNLYTHTHPYTHNPYILTIVRTTIDWYDLPP
jgi:hypothetical protein